MSKSVKDFLLLSLTSICILLVILAGLSYVYRYSTVSTYEMILMVMIGLVMTATLILALSAVTVFHAYRRKKVSPRTAWIFKLSLKILLPFISFFAELIKYNKEEIRRFYVNVNNIIVQSGSCRYKPEQVLILLPHCLQSSSCEYKITSDIQNCRKCGKCCIGKILDLAEDTNVRTVVATGGTLARNVIASAKPAFVLSVACERDLTSGISDVNHLPVIGIINERPMGPCHNTTVNVNILKEKLDNILIR
ncbi:MAG: DUF116 domain-containing protein [Clostridia bacterium]|nr:DUF116 domain-containing protein [Clostridia bacterium]